MFQLIRLEKDPNSLLKLFLGQGVLSFILILVFTGIGIRQVAISDVLQVAENDAYRIATVLTNQNYPLLFNSGEQNVALNSEDLNTLNRQIRDFLHPFDIVKIKIFNNEKSIIYSTDSNLIGKVDGHNERLDKAILGQIDSHLEMKEEIVDLAEEQRFNVDVVETYLPIRNKSRQIAGVLEIYLDVTRYRNEVMERVVSSILLLTIILLFVFFLSFVIVVLATRHLKELLGDLREMARTDPLTGILNRGALMARAEEELSRLARQTDQPAAVGLGVIMIDLDRFKQINDQWGHHVGDEALCEAVRRIRSCLREYDVFGRYGGEEFLVLNPTSTVARTELLAERIRLKVVGVPLKIDDIEISLSASFGVTCCVEPKEGINSALLRADKALYQAKESGRDRVVATP